jgi:hypothetical protein
MKNDSIETKRPGAYNESVEKYLDDLRESGVTNMFGASLFLEEDFGMPKGEAHACLTFWMQSFPNR